MKRNELNSRVEALKQKIQSDSDKLAKIKAELKAMGTTPTLSQLTKLLSALRNIVEEI